MIKEKSDKPKKKVVVVEEVVNAPEEVKTEEIETPIEDVKVIEPVQEVANKMSPQPVPESEYEKSSYLWIIVPTALLVGALVGGLITYFSGIAKLNTNIPAPSPIPTTMPEVSVTPTPSPATTLKRDELKVQVLNGSGVSGAAGKAKTLLETAGYKNVDTGNATMSDLAQTEVAIKNSMKEYLNLVVEDLSKSYDAVEASKPLVTTSKYDIVITIGKK